MSEKIQTFADTCLLEAASLIASEETTRTMLLVDVEDSIDIFAGKSPEKHLEQGLTYQLT